MKLEEEKCLTYRGTNLRIIEDFSSETMLTEQSKIFEVLKEKNLEFYIQQNYPSKVKTEQVHSEKKQILTEFIGSRSALKKN